MRPQDRSRLIARAMQTGEKLDPATLVFDGFPPVPATKRTTAQTQALRFGGMTGAAPAIYFIRKEVMPAGLALVAQETCFLDGAQRLRVVSIDGEESEPQLRISTDLAGR